MEPEALSILIAIVILVFLALIMVFLFVIFQKRKNILLLEQIETEKRFEKEIAKTQIEIREETFRNISWELHDNIGQLLTLAKIQLQNTSNLRDVKKTLDKALLEIRTLSKLINPEALKNMKLTQAISQEIERFNKLNYIEAKLKILGQVYDFDSKLEIIFFRMLQEFFSNTIKHAKATKLDVILEYSNKTFTIIAKDNGKGFNISENKGQGIGLINIKKRARLIKANAEVKSKPGKGTKLKIEYKINHESL